MLAAAVPPAWAQTCRKSQQVYEVTLNDRGYYCNQWAEVRRKTYLTESTFVVQECSAFEIDSVNKGTDINIILAYCAAKKWAKVHVPQKAHLGALSMTPVNFGCYSPSSFRENVQQYKC